MGGSRVAAFWLAQLLALLGVLLPWLVLWRHPLVLLLAPSAMCVLCALVLLAVRSGLSQCAPPRRAAREFAAEPESIARRPLSVQTNLAARDPKLWLVDVAVLEDWLSTGGSAAALLEELHDSQSYRLLRPVLLHSDAEATTVEKPDFALISYRQQRAPSDQFTMDERALTSVVAVAKAAGVRSLWLDAWCHKVEGEYDHYAFCSTLTNVVRNARLVVWLPRARTDAAPEYQFRLWCSFEAAVIAARGLPVVIAGEGPTRSQRWLRHLGARMLLLPPFVPPMRGLTQLSLLNTLFLIATVLCPPMAIIYIFGLGSPRSFGASASPILGRQMQLAHNGSLVLDTLLGHAVRNPSLARLASMHPPNPALARRLLRRTLPWLPAYDRRDVLVIHSVLTAVMEDHRRQHEGVSGAPAGAAAAQPSDRAGSAPAAAARWAACRSSTGSLASTSVTGRFVAMAHELREQILGSREQRLEFTALAVSAYAAALLEPSPGDAPDGRPLRAWLAEKNLEPLAQVAPLETLYALGWIARTGASSTLTSPVGAMISQPGPPTAQSWSLADLTPVPQHGRGKLSLYLVGTMLVCIVLGFGVSVGSAAVGLGGSMLHPSLAVISATVLLVAVMVMYHPALLFTCDHRCHEAPHLTDPRQMVQPHGYQFMTSVGGRALGAAIYSCLLLPLAAAADRDFFARMADSDGVGVLARRCAATWGSSLVVFPDGTISACFFMHGLVLIHGVLSVLCCSQMAVAATFHMIYRGRSHGAHHLLNPPGQHGVLEVERTNGNVRAHKTFFV